MEYGPTYSVKLRDINVSAGSTIEASAAFMANVLPTAAKLVMSIDRDGKSLNWYAGDVVQFAAEKGKWARVSLVGTVPAELTGTEELKIYCWNEKKEVIRMDDVRIAVYGTRP
jgi:hypothetical protein